MAIGFWVCQQCRATILPGPMCRATTRTVGQLGSALLDSSSRRPLYSTLADMTAGNASNLIPSAEANEGGLDTNPDKGPANPSSSRKPSEFFEYIPRQKTPRFRSFNRKHKSRLTLSLPSKSALTPGSDAGSQTGPSPCPESSLKPVSELADILKSNSSVLVAWDYFCSHSGAISSALQQPNFLDLLSVMSGKVFDDLLQRMTVAWCDEIRSRDGNAFPVTDKETDVPLTSTVIDRLSSAGVLKPQGCISVIRRLVGLIYRLPPSEVTIHLPEVQELLRAWAHLLGIIQLRSDNITVRPSLGLVRWTLPDTSTVQTLLNPKQSRPKSDEKESRGLQERLMAVTRGLSVSGARQLSNYCLATFDIVTSTLPDSALHMEAQVKGSDGPRLEDLHEALPFILFASHLIHESHNNRAIEVIELELQELVERDEIPARTANEWRNRLPFVVHRAKFVFAGSEENQRLGKGWKTETESWVGPPLAGHFIVRLRDLEQRSAIGKVVETWEEIQRTFTFRDEDGQTSYSNIPARLYQELLCTFMSLRQYETAMTVWSHMTSHGVEPTLATWNSLVIGCRRAKWAVGVTNIWDELSKRGVQPDGQLYASSIYTLLAFGRPIMGLRLLQDMTKKWVTAARASGHSGPISELGDLPNAAKPSTLTFNAALAGIVRSKHATVAVRNLNINRLFKWAQSLQIRPDIVTFNTLMHSRATDQSVEGAMAVLDNMASHGIEPDVITFTTLSRLIFGRNMKLSPEELAPAVLKFIQELEARGIHPTGHLYSTLVYGLLLRHQNVAAAQAVLASMRARNSIPSVHIYTAVLTFHMRQPCPDIDAIESLWSSALGDGIRPDAVFYARLISLYGQAGQMKRMGEFVGRCVRDGVRLGWGALTEVLKAMVRIGDWDGAREVVRDVRTRAGVGRYVSHSNDFTTVQDIDRLGQYDGDQVYGVVGTNKREFWETVRRYRLEE